MVMQRVYLISLDFLENFQFSDGELNFIDVIKFLLSNNEKDLIISYSIKDNRLECVKNIFPFKHERLLFVNRIRVMDLIKEHNDNPDISFIVIGRKNQDFRMAVNNKLLFITPLWVRNLEEQADKYGIKVDSPYQLLEFMKTIINQKNWYSKLVLPDGTIVLSLTDARTFEKYTISKEEKEVIERFHQILKNGSRNFYEMYFYHFFSSISNNKRLFNDINYWGYFPSSSGHIEGNEMFKFKEKVREMMKGQPQKHEDYKKYRNLLVRHTPTNKSHETHRDIRIKIGSKKHFETVRLNKGFINKLHGKNICIFDDYLTHGNSFECARNLLRHAGVNKLIFVTLGRFVRPYQYQEYELTGDIYSPTYNYKLIKRYEIPLTEFEINEEAKYEVENLHSIFNLSHSHFEVWYIITEGGINLEQYVIALKLLNINNQLILQMLDTFTIYDFIDLFKGEYLALQFKFNIKLDKHTNVFSNIDLLNETLEKSKEIIKLSKKNKIKIALINSKKYPSILKSIKNPPAIIYYKGRGFYKVHNKSVGCVGTRSMTDFGKAAVEAIVPKLVDEGFTIVSGLAEGVDTLSHKKCLENNGRTIAVLAHGLDMIYPKTNTELANEIIKNKGLLVSEYPIGTKPDKFRFVERNRLISALSKGVVVFETKEKSGTMHTVNYAIEQNKPIFCPFPSYASETTSALIKLINNKTATPIPYRNSFETVVLGLGYKLKDKEKARKIKNTTITKLINSANIQKTDLDTPMNFEIPKYTGIRVDKDIYLKYKEVLKENDITGKELFNAFMLSVINTYKK